VAEVVELGSVTGFVVFDLPGAPLSAGGTRLAADVSVAEVALLARAMTYKFAALGQQVGGAKAGVRGDPADRAGKAGLMTRFCAEVRPLVEAGRFLTGPDMGTAQGADVLRQRGVVALPDFVCNAGAGVTDLDRARELLGFPADRSWAFLVSLGYPADRPLTPVRNPRRRPLGEVVHRGRW
jgi:hypothetical protein